MLSHLLSLARMMLTDLFKEPEALGQAQKLYFEHKAGPLTIGGMRKYLRA